MIKMVEMILIAYIIGMCTFIHGMVGFMVGAVKLWVHVVIDVDPWREIGVEDVDP